MEATLKENYHTTASIAHYYKATQYVLLKNKTPKFNKNTEKPNSSVT